MDIRSEDHFTGKPRIRVCGLATRGDSILLLNHSGLYGRDFWSPPGGGAIFGEKSAETLVREFREECGLVVIPKNYLFTCAVIRGKIHALELFFDVEVLSGQLITGIDPELGDHQILTAAEYLPFSTIEKMKSENLHPIFSKLSHPSDILGTSGFHECT